MVVWELGAGNRPQLPDSAALCYKMGDMRVAPALLLFALVLPLFALLLPLPAEGALAQKRFENLTEEEAADYEIFEGTGCIECNNTGYRGRTGVFEVMPLTDSICRIILEEGNALRIAEQARKESVADLRASALRKVAAGVTDLIEINRVTKD